MLRKIAPLNQREDENTMLNQRSRVSAFLSNAPFKYTQQTSLVTHARKKKKSPKHNSLMLKDFNLQFVKITKKKRKRKKNYYSSSWNFFSPTGEEVWDSERY